MTMPFNPAGYGAPAPGPAPIPMPPGQATFNAPAPAVPATVVREQGWQGYPTSAIPPMPQPPAPQPQPGQFQPAPQPTGQYQIGQPVPTQFVQPQTQPGQQFQPVQPTPQQQGIPAGIDPNTVLSGPQFPPELQGVTLGQAVQMYGGMRQLVLGMQQRQYQQVAPQTQAPAPSQPAPGAPAQTPAFDWRNPMPQFQQMIGQMLDERLAPVTQQSQLNAAAQARQAVAAEIGTQRFAQIEPHVLRYLQGATPADLANPELWRVATRTAIGELALNGQGQQQQQPNRQPAGQQYGGAVPFQPGMQNPAPPLQSFFTEQSQQGAPVQGVTLTPTQMWFADQMGVPHGVYAAHVSGIPEMVPQNGGRR